MEKYSTVLDKEKPLPGASDKSAACDGRPIQPEPDELDPDALKAKGPPYTGRELLALWKKFPRPQMSLEEADEYAKDIMEAREKINAFPPSLTSSWE